MADASATRNRRRIERAGEHKVSERRHRADRPDLAYAVKENARRMAGPGCEDLGRVARVAKHALSPEFSRIAQVIQVISMPSEIVVCSGSDRAGCRETRRSTYYWRCH